ncbi:stage II sporulation protein M [Halopiger djelfimassiliensis]|uniref:stage II sporulation protein M n=1 Tax=Halopiger djelfimassiliensis TaxID=1293047 RepID=UPI0006776FC8|nr:stage II sporulation protein M [Halopiger djelfimassiliensis]
MSLSDPVAAAVAVLRRRPGDILPLYLLGAAIPAIVRVVPFLAALVGYLYLETTGRFETIRAHLTDIEAGPPDPETEPEAFQQWVSGFEPAVEQLLTPATVGLALLTIATVAILFLVLSSVISAGQLGACYGRLRDERGLIAGIAAVRRYWTRILWLYVLEGLVWLAVGVAVALITAVAVGAASIAAGTALLTAPVALLGILVLLAVLAAVRALFAFAPVAVVVDDAGVFGSVSKSFGFVRRRPIGAGFYYALSVGTMLAVSTVSGVLMLVDVVSATSLVTVLVVLPALDLLKTALYVEYRGRLAPPTQPTRTLRAQFRDGLGRGWSELIAFVRSTPGTHAVVVALAGLGFAGGWLAADPFVGHYTTSIAARLDGHVPPAAALEFFGNNWLVAMTTTYAGVALVIPAIVSVLFNGAFMGVYARLEVEPAELAAFILPHGVFEIPAIIVASALGIRLGLVGWRAYRGRASRVAFADALERAFWVLLGVGLLLAVAAVIEGFVSPYYYRLFL